MIDELVTDDLTVQLKVDEKTTGWLTVQTSVSESGCHTNTKMYGSLTSG